MVLHAASITANYTFSGSRLPHEQSPESLLWRPGVPLPRSQSTSPIVCFTPSPTPPSYRYSSRRQWQLKEVLKPIEDTMTRISNEAHSKRANTGFLTMQQALF